MERVPEPELMVHQSQVAAYANGDFSIPHNAFVEQFVRYFPDVRSDVAGRCLDIGAGPCDITVRMARRFPQMVFTALDGSKGMLEAAKDRLAKEKLQDRVSLLQTRLPSSVPKGPYDFIISNSLLHHLHEPDVLWQSIIDAGHSGTKVLVMDLFRASSLEDAREKTQKYCAHEPKVLQEDFYNSLCAAFSLEEVFAMIKNHHLKGLRVETISDRHLVVYGEL